MVNRLIFILFLAPCLASAQSIAGVWPGTITQTEGGYTYKYGVELNLRQSGTIVTGTSKVWLLEDPKVFAVMKLSGEFKNNRLSYRESEITHQEDLGGYYWCYKGARLDIKLDPKERKLEGPWWGTGPTPTCPPGMIYVKQPNPEEEEPPVVVVDEDKEEEEKAAKLKEEQERIEKEKQAQLEKEKQERERLEAERIEKEKQEQIARENAAKTPQKVNGRDVKVQASAEVSQRDMTIYIWDTDDVDGDRVTVYFNGEEVLRNHKITKDRYALTLTLKPGEENFLVLFAENEGKNPPNTAAVSWWEGSGLKTKVLHSTMKESGTLTFKAK